MESKENRNSEEQALNVCFFPNIRGKGENKPIVEVLDDIKNGKWQSEIEEIRKSNSAGNTTLTSMLKNKLPAFTPSGEFNKRHNLKSIAKYNPVVIVDFDHVETDIEQFRKRVEDDAHTWISFVSPRGEGLKVLVKVDSAKSDHQQAFNQVKLYYEQLTGHDVDSKNKDISRLCFVSWDPDAYMNNGSAIFKVSKLSTEEKNKRKFERTVSFTERKETYIEGNRNNFIHLLACNCNRYGLNEQTTLSFILNNYKGLTEQEIKNTVHSAFNNMAEHGEYDYVATKTHETVTFTKPNSTLYTPLLKSIAYYDKLPEPEYIWGAIVEGSFGYIFGPPGVGKTILCENFGLCIAVGVAKYLGQQIENSRKRSVLFIAMEEYGKFSRSRNKKQIKKLDLDEGEEFIYNVSTEEFPDYFGNEKDWEKLEKVIADSRAEVVIIDSMTRATDGQIEDSSIGRKISIRLRSIAQKYNVTLIVIHHSTKLNGNKITLDSLAGSRVIAQEADFVYAVNMVDNVRYLKELKSRYKQLKEEVTTFKINDYAWLENIDEVHENYLVSTFDNRENPANDQIIIEAVQQNTSEDETKVETKVVQEAVLDNVKKTEFYRRLKKLSKMGKLKWDSPYISLP